MADGAIPLTPNEALSGISGSISIAAWIFLLIPQLYENYSQKSAAGVSIPFLLIWFVGDLLNLGGAVWGGLIPTVIALAVYVCISDNFLILQCAYYNLWVNRNHRNPLADPQRVSVSSDTRPHFRQGYRRGSGGTADSTLADSPDEEEPLLSRTESTGFSGIHSNVGLPGSHSHRKSSAAATTLGKVIEEDDVKPSALRSWLQNTACIILVCVAGTAGWTIAYNFNMWTPTPAPQSIEGGQPAASDQRIPIGAEILGYGSAIFYLGARIPQIIKNWRERSCEGLSLLFFLLSLLGNLSYGGQILFHSLERQYIITNLPWLFGSLGTMAQDVIIFAQFHFYGDKAIEKKDANEDAIE